MEEVKVEVWIHLQGTYLKIVTDLKEAKFIEQSIFDHINGESLGAKSNGMRSENRWLFRLCAVTAVSITPYTPTVDESALKQQQLEMLESWNKHVKNEIKRSQQGEEWKGEDQ